MIDNDSKLRITTLRNLLLLLDNNSSFSIVTEGVNQKINGVSVRLDTPNAFHGQQLHVHVDKYAWNVDGSRSHKGLWLNKEPSKKIKSIAAKQLGVDMSILENYMDLDCIIKPDDSDMQIVLESVGMG